MTNINTNFGISMIINVLDYIKNQFHHHQNRDNFEGAKIQKNIYKIYIGQQ